MEPFVAVWAGVLLAGGCVLLAAGLRRHPVRSEVRPRLEPQSIGQLWARISRRPPGAAGRRRDLILLAALIIGFAVAAVSGWLVMILVLPAIAWALPVILKPPTDRDVALLEGLDRWVRNLAASLPTGKSIPDAIRISGRTAPEPIREPLSSLITRLNNRWDSREALMRFADDLDSPDADTVIAALILATNRGANGAAVTLSELADSIQAQLKGRREIETERAKPYLVVRQVTVITLGTLAIAFAFAGDYFAPYASGPGQLVLAVLAALYLAALMLMRRRAMPPKRQRILVGVRR
ncbi:MAG TPA: type II secretion system F family protein [Microlunatus sp.]